MQPQTEAELAQMILESNGLIAVTGGGTRLLPGEGHGSRLDMGAMTGITLYEPEALTLVVRAGTLLSDVTAALAAEGQMLGFEPDAREGSTIGGVAASNASGPRRVQVGACRDAMLGVRYVSGQGEIVKNGGRVMKNVTGYDLVKLQAGARGRLGVLTEIAFKTAPLPPCMQVLALPDLDATAAVAALTQALTGPYDVSGAGWLAGEGALIRLEGLAGSVALRGAQLQQKLGIFGRVEQADPSLWTGLVLQRAEGGDLWRIICRPSEAGNLLAHLPAPLALDWGGALIWVALPKGQQPSLPRFSGQAMRMTGDAPLILPAPNPVIVELEQGLQGRFDPRGIFDQTARGGL